MNATQKLEEKIEGYKKERLKTLTDLVCEAVQVWGHSEYVTRADIEAWIIKRIHDKVLEKRDLQARL